MSNERQHLFSKDAERSLLGGIIRHPESRKPVFEIITDSTHFYDYAHQLIYKAIRKLVDDGVEPELTTLAEELHGADFLREIGGPMYLAQIWEDATVTNQCELARKVVDLSVRRNAVRELAEIEKRLANRSIPAYSALMESARHLSSLTYPLLSEQQKQEDNVVTYQPFPLDALFSGLQEFIEQTAQSMPCDPGLLVLPTLCTVAACIGSKRAIQLKPGWVEKCILWGCTIAEPSSMKSPAADKCGYPLWVINATLAKTNKEEERSYSAKMEQWRQGCKETKGEATMSHFRAMPEPPPVKLLAVNDTTIESLYQILADNPQGVIAWHDELRGWMKSMGRYTSGGGGGEEAAWLQFWSGGHGSIHRKGQGKQGIVIPNRHVGLCGNIQPTTFAKMMTEDQFENGMMARFLLAYPPRLIGEFNDEIVDPKTSEGYLTLCRNLFFDSAGAMEEETYRPSLVTLTATAKRAWKSFYDAWQKRIATSDGAMAFSLKKLEAYAARFALLNCVVEFIWTQARVCYCTEKHIANAVRMVEWFESEAIRVYRMMRDRPDARTRDQLLALIGRNSGAISPRQLQRANPAKFTSTEIAVQALDGLVKEGKGRWEERPPSEKGGRPTRTFVAH